MSSGATTARKIERGPVVVAGIGVGVLLLTSYLLQHAKLAVVMPFS